MITHDARYRGLAERIAGVIERRPGDHVHGYLTSLRGVMDLYSATSDPRFLRQCEAAWREIAQSEDLLITGGVPEGWSPNKHRTEGCAEADWVRLSLSLWKATGNPQYLSMAERATFNEFALNQFATGDFGHRVLTETGITADGAARAWWCCTLHGLRCFPDIHASTFRGENEALFYDLPLDSEMHNGAVSGERLSATAASSLAQDGSVRITIISTGGGPNSLRIRKPEWADALAVRVNDDTDEFPLEGGYVDIHRTWRTGDVVTVGYGMSLRTQSSEKKRIAYSFGPWLLGAPQSDDAAYFNELTTENQLAPARLQPLSSTKQPERAFTVPIAATSFPYTPAEFPDQQGTVTLRAVSEQTGQPSTCWEFRFLTKETA